MNW
ncbi:806c85e2-cb0c-4f32-9c96-ae6b811c1c97 [Thermothielavioides terrestris]|jgi:hypothetical protein